MSPAGAAARLSYGEERTAVRQGHGQGAPGRIYGLTPLVGSAGFLGPPFHRSVGAGKLLDGDLLQKYIPYVF